MKARLSQFAGFCDGVKRAYDMVSALDMEKIKKPVFVLGSLVHNSEVMKKIEEKGISKLKREDFFSAACGRIGTLIVTAHGDGPEIFARAKKNNIDIIDTTCPKVMKVQRLAKVYSERGYRIIIIGDRDHKEVKGIDDWSGGEAVIISQPEDWEDLEAEAGDKIAVLCQTTQNKDFFQKAVGEIERKFPQNEKVFLGTICQTTEERQNEVKKMAKESDLVLVIGSKESANSKRLYEIALGENRNSYFIENAGEMKKRWFFGIEKVAIAGGASTPPWVIEEALELSNKFLNNPKGSKS